MMVPVRCFTCGKVIGHLKEEYEKKVEEGMSKGKALDEVGLKRYCCRQAFLGQVDLIKEIAQFKP